MSSQISVLEIYDGEDIDELKDQAEKLSEYVKQKRKWENAFQKWSDKCGMSEDITGRQG